MHRVSYKIGIINFKFYQFNIILNISFQFYIKFYVELVLNTIVIIY